MDNSLIRFLYVLVIFAIWQNGLGCALKIDINTTTTSSTSTEMFQFQRDVHISCCVDDSPRQVKEILVLEMLNQKGKAIAVLRPNSGVLIEAVTERKVEAVGEIPKNISESYLQVRLPNIRPDEAGVYSCGLFYLNESGLLHEVWKNANLVLTYNDVTTMLNEMTGKLAQLETELYDQNRDSLVLESRLKDQTAQLETVIAERNKEREAFSAAYTKSIKLSRGDVMIFDDVIVNEGQGYSAASGMFTASRAGLYSFDLSLCVRGRNWIDVDIKANGRSVQQLVTGDTQFDEQSSVSVLIKLEAGEKVKPVVTSTSTPFANNGIIISRSKFSGYILNPL